MLTKDELITLLQEDVSEFNQYIADNQSAGIDLTEVDFSNITASDANFLNVDLSSSTFADSHLTNVKFENCDLTSSDFTRSNLAECYFTSSILNGTDFSYATVDYCNFHEADMAGCVLQETDLTNSDLSTSYNLNACRFDDGTVWPDNDMLPEDFDGMYSADLSSLKDDEDEGGNQDY